MAGMKNSNLWGKIAVFLIILGVCAGTAMALSGSGTEADPWRITSLADFDDFAADANYWDDYTRLETDVNLAGRIYTTAVIAPDVDSTNLIYDGIGFTGVFDGNDHKIMHLTINDGGAGNRYLALFGSQIGASEVRDLGLEGTSVRGERIVGGLVGYNYYGTISDCYSRGGVSGSDNVGGLVGWTIGGDLSDSHSAGVVGGTENVGGLVGYNSRDSSVTNSYSSGFVSGMDYVGGLVGHNLATIRNCYSTGSVAGTGKCIGGLVGRNYGGISKCYSVGEVTGVNYVGGLMGKNDGVVGSNFWDVHTSGWATSDGGIPKTTTEMKTQSIFAHAGWDFIEIWNIGENQTYPYLRTVPAGDINKDKTVNFLDLCIIAQQWCNQE